LFRRSKTVAAPETSVSLKEGGKGRPTPTRAQAQAAAKARAKGPQDKKAAARARREQRSATSAKAREGLRTGDERYLPARDKGPVRRFVRDYVDSRLSMAELLLPLLILVMVSSVFNPTLSNALWTATIVLVALDTALLVFRLRREVARRFPGDVTRGATTRGATTKGAVGYGVLRAMQVRFFRLPKSTTKLGAKLPNHY
jgi:hypothetical protein